MLDPKRELHRGLGSYVRDHKDQVRLPLQPVNQNRRNHHNGKIPKPVTRDPNCGTLRPHSQRQNLRHIDPRHTVDTPSKDKHIREEESHGGRSRRLGDRGAFEAEQDGNHHHGEAESGTSPEHGLSAPHLVEEEGRDKGAKHEHHVDAAAEDLSEFGFEADVLDENSWVVSMQFP